MVKKATPSAQEQAFTEENREAVLRIIYDKADQEPPVGERYPVLLREIIEAAIREHGVKLSKAKHDETVDELFDYIASYGPIEKYFNDLEISEIMVNGPDHVYIEKGGEIFPTDLFYENNMHVRFAINHIINPMGRYVNQKHPLVDSRLPDGSRVNVIIPPAAPNSPSITIRRFLKDKLTIDQLIDLNSLDRRISDFLEICVRARMNIVVAGNTSSGKTTFLNILARYIPERERIVTIEDSAELSLHQPHVVSLEAQPPDFRGEGEVTVRDLVKNSLRMRPDRIIVGEVRSGESIDMLQAMNTGHDGSLTTVHSNSPRDTVARLETMALMAGLEMPVIGIRRQIASALNLIVYLSRMADGSRRLTHVSEVVGMEGDIVTMTDLFLFQQTGVSQDHKITGAYRPTGLRPSFSEALSVAGERLDYKLFSN